MSFDYTNKNMSDFYRQSRFINYYKILMGNVQGWLPYYLINGYNK